MGSEMCIRDRLNIDQLKKGFTTELISLTYRTISLGIITALVALIFSLILTLSNRQNKNLLMRLITFPAGIGYAIPGTVLAISLISISNSKFYFIAIFLLIWGYVVRFLTISKGSLDSGFERISPTLDEAAKGLGSNWVWCYQEDTYSTVKRSNLCWITFSICRHH